MDYSSLLSPLVAVSGLDHTNDNEFSKHKHYALDKITLSRNTIPESPVHQKLITQLKRISSPPAPWNPQNVRQNRLNFHFGNDIEVYPTEKRPTPLSPKNRDNSAPIFSVEWLRKYAFFYPTSACIFFKLPDNQEDDEDLIEELLDIRTVLAHHGIYLVAVVVGELESLRGRVAYIRKQSSLAPRTGLLTLVEDAGDEVLGEFIDLLCNTLVTLSQNFFATKQRKIRERRESVAPPMDVMIWDARYTIKLAYCSELRGDLGGSVRLFESAYDTLSLLFKNKVFEKGSKEYVNAREALDATAIRIFQHSLPDPSAFDKFIVHLSIVDDNMNIYGLNKNSSSALRWRAFQYALFAHFCAECKRAAPTDTISASKRSELWANPGGCSLGLIWLDVAKLLIAKPDESGDGEDGYDFEPIIKGVENSRSEDDNLLDIRSAFLKSISELSEYRRAKAYALAEYGKWLEDSDPTASLQAYKSGSQSFPGKFWPEVQKEFSKKTGDELALFAEGVTKEFPRHISGGSTPLFDVKGTFKSLSTYVGRETSAQVTLYPIFSGELDLLWVKFVHSLGVVHLESVDTVDSVKPEQRLVDVSNNNSHKVPLKFAGNCARTFQFGVTSLDIGEIELEEVQFQVKDSDFVQSIGIKPEQNQWLTSAQVNSNTIRHLKRNPDATKIQVTVRPAKIKVADNLISVAASGEHLRYRITLTNDEDEIIKPEITVMVKSNETSDPSEEEEVIYHEDMKSDSKSLEVGADYSIGGEFKAPLKIFEFVVLAKFETAKDSLPVMMEHRKEVDVLRPFRVSFDLLPEYYAQKWPAIFSPTLDLPELSRKWWLKPSVLSMVKDSELILRESNVTIECEQGKFEFENQTVNIDKSFEFNSLLMISHSFICCRNEESRKSLASARPLEAKAFLHLKWSRKATPDIVNTFTLPPVRLNLPTHEPRVIVSKEKSGGDSSVSEVTYHIENPTPRVLNFSVSMASSTYFAFQGPKIMSLRMLPFSSRSLKYQLIPLGDAAVQNRRPLPDIRVYDVNYKRTLAAQPGDKSIVFEQGSLFI